MAEEQPARYLDRYEVVAIALPGAALILFMLYLHPDLVGASKLDLKDISIGAFGIFTISALIAGQVVQGFANITEELLNVVADLVRRSPVESLPQHKRKRFVAVVTASGVENPGQIDRRRYRRELGKDITRIARSRDSNGTLQIANVSYGLHRGLAIASLIAIIDAAIMKSWQPAIVLTLIFATTAFRAARFSRRYEGEALRLYLQEKPQLSGES